MSSIYIQEPPTSGKVLLKTTVGDIDVELWAKEAPKAARNFVQLCMEGYYNGTIFHRLVKGFIVQGGDPNGDGTGGESIYGKPFRDEFHTRLRFARRGLLAMANAGKDDNGSQFFFTLGATPELQNKHTIFGKVTGETLYNMLKLEEAEVDLDERPQYPQKILKTEILNNPFPDIVPRRTVPTFKESVKPRKEKKKGVKNFKLLSFGEEAEEDEAESTSANKKYSGKGKSSHDVLDDPTLDSTPAVNVESSKKRKKSASSDGENNDLLSGDEGTSKKEADKFTSEFVRNKLKNKVKPETSKKPVEEEYYIGKDRHDERKRKAEDIRKEIRDFKKGISDEKKSKLAAENKQEEEKQEKLKKKKIVDSYHEEQEAYKKLAQAIPKKGASREEFTLGLLAKFQKKMVAARQKTNDNDDDDDDDEKPKKVSESKKDDSDGEIAEDPEDDSDETWLSHRLQFEDRGAVLARDASTKGDDWFEIYDPRNPLTKRRREESKKILSTRR